MSTHQDINQSTHEWTEWVLDPTSIASARYYRTAWDEATADYIYDYYTPEESTVPRGSSATTSSYLGGGTSVNNTYSHMSEYKYDISNPSTPSNTGGQDASNQGDDALSNKFSQLATGGTPLSGSEKYSKGYTQTPNYPVGGQSRAGYSIPPPSNDPQYQTTEKYGSETKGKGKSKQNQHEDRYGDPSDKRKDHHAKDKSSSKHRNRRDSTSQGHQPTRKQKADESGQKTPKAIWANVPADPKTGKKESILDEDFKIYNSKCFNPGEIFKVLWVEPKGVDYRAELPAAPTDVTRCVVGETKLGEQSYASIRRFVVVARGHGSCQCLPILTYGQRGTLKPGLRGEDHAIIFTGDQIPDSVQGEYNLRSAIQVDPKSLRDKLDVLSRVNYSKIYTVEHNVKVKFVGKISVPYQQQFMLDFDAVWEEKTKMTSNPSGPYHY